MGHFGREEGPASAAGQAHHSAVVQGASQQADASETQCCSGQLQDVHKRTWQLPLAKGIIDLLSRTHHNKQMHYRPIVVQLSCILCNSTLHCKRNWLSPSFSWSPENITISRCTTEPMLSRSVACAASVQECYALCAACQSWSNRRNQPQQQLIWPRYLPKSCKIGPNQITHVP